MALNPLKRIVKSTLNRDPIEQIFWGTPTGDTYTKVLLNYRMYPTQLRQQTILRCLKKLSKPKQAQLIIANLALIQKLMKIDNISLPNNQPQMIQTSKKKQITMSQKNIIRFYYQFIKKQQQQIINKLISIQDKINFCQIGLNKCLSIINNNIVIQYCLLHSLNQVTLRIALKQIFQNCRKDLQITNNFINQYAKIIYQENNSLSFAINQIYQTLIFVSKNIHKISVLIKKAGLAINLPVYQMNKDLNMKIQMKMNSRRDQKTKFKTQKHIKSKENIQFQQHNNQQPQIYQKKSLKQRRVSQSLSQIDQDQILIQSQELL